MGRTEAEWIGRLIAKNVDSPRTGGASRNIILRPRAWEVFTEKHERPLRAPTTKSGYAPPVMLPNMGLGRYSEQDEDRMDGLQHQPGEGLLPHGL